MQACLNGILLYLIKTNTNNNEERVIPKAPRYYSGSNLKV